MKQGEYNILEASIKDLQQALQSGQITSKELVDRYLKRIATYDKQGPALNSILYINPKASEEAKALDQERKEKGPRGPLHGIPIILKDNFNTYDMPTTGASMALAGSIPPEDAFLTKKLREAGAIIIAKANLHELARSGTTVSSLGGQTLNPYDLTRTPGGSSGGTGAAIAANFAVVGTGTDTVNSVRSPSSANNLVGVRPTMGLLSRSGIIPAALTQDMAGPIARTVYDAAVMLDAMAGYDPNDPTTAWSVGQIPKNYTDSLKQDGLKGKRLGVIRALFGNEDVHQEVNLVMERALEDLKVQGAEIIEITNPDLSSGKISKEMDVQLYESKSQLNAYFESLGPDAPIKSVTDLLATGTVDPTSENGLRDTNALEDALNTVEYKDRILKTLKLRETLMKEMADNNLDAFIYPHQARLVVKVGEGQADRNGIVASMSGFPAITVPGGFSTPDETTPIGVPIGIEFLGRPFSEPVLFEIAYAYEQATHHRTLPPTTP